MNTPHDIAHRVEAALAERFGTDLDADVDLPGLDELARIAMHRSHRKYAEQPVDPTLLRLLFACALSAPSKSDLQQADVIHVTDAARRKVIVETMPDMPWIMNAPTFLVFCANNRRIRQIGEWRGKPFVNEHLDHFMNAAVDAGLVMMNFIRAAEAVGLGTCPISAVRNRADTVSDVLELPEGVFPVAGLCVGYPAEAGRITPRLALNVTVHQDRYNESDLREKIDADDRRRHAVLPYRQQRHVERFGQVPFYGWSEDKARQYAVPERADFGAFIRKQGFSLK
ncbi:MAG: nitroreductase family protein [Betaproteobacteria bacterium]|nr:nitroreductase family protein [Betaproteobacteria bacterium]MDH3436862.1 nitroreductase family protein [Betaproteobacteria bacterium]